MQMTSTESLEQVHKFSTAPRFELFRGRGRSNAACGRELCDGLDWGPVMKQENGPLLR